MSYVELRLEDIARNNDDGVSVVDEVEEAMRTIGRTVLDERFGRKGTISLTLEVAADDDREAVLVRAKIATKMPARKHKVALAYVNPEGRLVRQKAEQMELGMPSSNVTKLDPKAGAQKSPKGVRVSPEDRTGATPPPERDTDEGSEATDRTR